MKKVAIIFVVAVLLPSFALAWLAVRSLRDQQFLIERQQALLYQGVANSVSKDLANLVTERQRDFGLNVEAMLGESTPIELAGKFDERLRKVWPGADVGFVVSLDGKVYAPSLFGRKEARQFRLENDKFLCSTETVQVYWNSPKGNINLTELDKEGAPQPDNVAPVQQQQQGELVQNSSYGLKGQKRNVAPQMEQDDGYSKVAAAEAEFRQLVGNASEGAVARFLQNELKLMIWYRSTRDPKLVFGAQLDLKKFTDDLRTFLQSTRPFEEALRREICVAVLDEGGRPVARTASGFNGNWKKPFVATEIGEVLPHWEVGVYLLNPASLTESARTLRITLGLLIGILLMAIVVGGWLIVSDLRRQLAVARQKTDFVSNVSHELKTPLTSIRMFSELLAEGRVQDPEKQKNYLGIISTETARLTRLINNVLDFSRMERGEKKYDLQRIDLAELLRSTAEVYRTPLESAGFRFEVRLPEEPLFANVDRDAIAQVIVNLISNAEKYSDGRKEIEVDLAIKGSLIELRVMDRGTGVPGGCEEKIFEQFYRAHDSLGSGIQGSGLGLTLARKIARGHSGDLVFCRREKQGSCFALHLPIDAQNLGPKA